MINGEKSSNIFNEIWGFLASIKLTIIVLLTLAATSIIGTLIPQNESHEAYIRTYGEVIYKIFYALDIFDMYHSWWFRFLILMLTANIIVCSIDRLSSLWKIIFIKSPSFKLSSFQKLSKKEKFEIQLDSEQLKKNYLEFMAKSFGYTQNQDTENGFCIFGEKGRWTRLGVYIVHLSIILLLIGGLIGSIFGFEGFVNIPEGEKTNTIRLRNNGENHMLEFEIQCNDFNVSFYDSGAPKEFRSSLTIIKDGKSVFKKDIIVNDPIRYKGINIFQSSYGKMPVNIKPVNNQAVNISFTSKESGMVYNKQAVLGQSIELPEGQGKFVLKDMIPSYKFMGQRDLGAAFVGVLTPKEGEPKEIHLPLRFSKFDKMRQGSHFVISVTSDAHEHSKEIYYTGLQITHDPGVIMVYAGFIMMIIGCFITFFMSHQKVCIEVIEDGQKCQIIVSGKANKNQVAMENYIYKIAKKLSVP